MHIYILIYIRYTLGLFVTVSVYILKINKFQVQIYSSRICTTNINRAVPSVLFGLYFLRIVKLVKIALSTSWNNSHKIGYFAALILYLSTCNTHPYVHTLYICTYLYTSIYTRKNPYALETCVLRLRRRRPARSLSIKIFHYIVQGWCDMAK